MSPDRTPDAPIIPIPQIHMVSFMVDHGKLRPMTDADARHLRRMMERLSLHSRLEPCVVDALDALESLVRIQLPNEGNG